jgi:enoyl-CoA hydratase
MNAEKPAGPSPSYETSEPVGYESLDSVAWVTMRRPKFANAQNSQMTYALDEAFRRAVDDDGIKVVVLCGEGKHFSAGHDIGTPGRDINTSWPRRSLFYDHVDKPGAEFAYTREQEVYLAMCHRWRDIPKPTIAMVQGACIAGALALAWVCDLCVASDDAYFQDPVLKMGIPGIEYFAHAFEMPVRLAKEFLYLGTRLTAQRAYEFGMVNRVVPREQLRLETLAMAQQIAAAPRFPTSLAKQALNYAEDLKGRRAAINAAFQGHHLAHAQNLLMTGDLTGGIRAKDIAAPKPSDVTVTHVTRAQPSGEKE